MACWAHVRRHVYEHQHNDATASGLPLALINKIYEVERRAAGKSLEERGVLRATETRMYLDRLRDWLDGPVAASLLPTSKLAGAFNYIRNHWEAIRAYRSEERQEKASTALEQAAKRRLRSELRKSMKG